MTFAVGLVLLVVGLVCMVASAFVESGLVNTLSAGLVAGVVLTPFGWLGR